MTVRTLLVGLGGYGNGYVDAILDHGDAMGLEFAGAVDPLPEGCRRLDEVRARVGTIHPDLAGFYAAADADLAVISAPIQYHAPYSIAALGAGSHVLCEKPVAASLEDALAMAEAADASRRMVAIGYQWSFSQTFERMRREIAAGAFGEPLSLRILAFWPRSSAYYGRASWAGRIRASDGSLVMDSPAHNATAHYLHNALSVLGPGGEPVSVQAELYRANEIENYDTAAIRARTASGADVLFYTTHAVPSNVGPMIWYRFRDADLVCDVPGNFYCNRADGSVEDYGSPDVTHRGKLERMAAAIRSAGPGETPESPCSVQDALAQLRVVCAAGDSSPVVPFPARIVRRTTVDAEKAPAGSSVLTWADGLQAVFTQCFARGLLPAEHPGVGWARSGSVVHLD